MTVAPKLVLPTLALVEAAAARFDRGFALGENALSEVKRLMPGNTVPAHILIKVIALNRLYSTQIYAVETVALHIAGMGAGLDAALAHGDLSVVDEIAEVQLTTEKKRHFFSFATKYCSWHNPEAYPIYDSRVYAYLWKLEKQTKALHFHDSDVWTNTRFVKIMNDFRKLYGLESVPYRKIDKFLCLASEGQEEVAPLS